MDKENSINKKRQAEVQPNRLVVLPFGKSVEIAYQSIKVRFFRSMITTLSLVLAVSFLSFIQIGVDSANGLLSTGNPTYRQALVRAGYDLAPEDQTADSSPKQRWLVVLSLLVCVVGIVNAQLMAVTERFREIGTMKCLGALDRFILRLFLLEAGMQGVAGAVIGAVLGAIFSILVSLLKFGWPVMTNLPLAQAGGSLLWSVFIGCLLSLLGVLYPAVIASRMQPVEAMRVEQ